MWLNIHQLLSHLLSETSQHFTFVDKWGLLHAQSPYIVGNGRSGSRWAAGGGRSMSFRKSYLVG